MYEVLVHAPLDLSQRVVPLMTEQGRGWILNISLGGALPVARPAVHHHHMLHVTTRVTGAILWANLHLLFWLSLVPFVTGWMGENHFAAVPTALYGVVLLMAAIAYLILQRQILHAEGPHSVLAAAVGRDVKGKISLVFYLLAIGAAFVDPRIAEGLYAAGALMWLIPDRRMSRRARALARAKPRPRSPGPARTRFERVDWSGHALTLSVGDWPGRGGQHSLSHPGASCPRVAHSGGSASASVALSASSASPHSSWSWSAVPGCTGSMILLRDLQRSPEIPRPSLEGSTSCGSTGARSVTGKISVAVCSWTYRPGASSPPTSRAASEEWGPGTARPTGTMPFASAGAPTTRTSFP